MPLRRLYDKNNAISSEDNAASPSIEYPIRQKRSLQIFRDTCRSVTRPEIHSTTASKKKKNNNSIKNYRCYVHFSHQLTGTIETSLQVLINMIPKDSLLAVNLFFQELSKRRLKEFRNTLISIFINVD